MNTLLHRCTTVPALGALVLLVAAAAAAAPSTARPDARSTYAREQVRCRAMRVHGERANCLSEASTAYQASLPPEVDTDPGRYARNALARCQPLTADDRQDCLARMAGQGTTSGSVSGGGIYRELVTREPAAASSAASR